MPDEKEMYDVPGFAKLVRDKFDAYHDMDDLDLTNKVLAKYPDYAGMVSPTDPPPKKPKGDVNSILDRMRGSLVTQESGGRSKIQNPRTKATGLVQVMPANIPVWTKKYLGRAMGQSQFANDTNAQEKVFRGEMGKYLEKALRIAPDEDTAIRMAAAAWYGGEGRMKNYDANWGGKGKEPTFREYTTSILNRMKKSGDAPSSGAAATFPIGVGDGPQASVSMGQIQSEDPETGQWTPEEAGAWNARFPGAPVKPTRLGQMAQAEAQNMLDAEGQKFIEGVTNNGTPLSVGADGLLQLPPGQPGQGQPQGEFKIDGPEAARAAYEDFLQKTGMKPGLDSLTEFNTVQQTLGAMKLPTQEEAQKWLDTPSPQQPQGLATGEGGLIDTTQPGLGGAIAPVKPFETRFAVSGDAAKDKDELASRASNSIGVDYDLIRDYLSEGEGLVGDNKSKTQFTPEMAAKLKGKEKAFGLDAAAVEDLQAMQVRRDRLNARTAELSKGMNLAEPPEAAAIQAAMDEGVLSFRKGRTLYHQARNDYIDWLVRKGLGDEKEIREAFNLPVAEQGAFFATLESAGRAVGLGSLIDAYRAENPDRIRREIGEEIKKYGSLAKSNKRAERIEKEYGTIGDSTRPMARPTEFALNLFRKIAELPAEASTLLAAGADAMSPAGISPKDNPFFEFSKDWKARIEEGRNKDLSDETITRHLADATAQVLEQAILTPLTGGASMLLPIGQAAAGQYEQAAEAGDSQKQRLFRTAIGGLAGAPGALLNWQWLKGLDSTAKAGFFDRLTTKLATSLTEKMGVSEARRAAATTVNGILLRAPGGGFTEYAQEYGEDAANKGVAKAVGSKGTESLTWASIFRPSLEEEKGYLAAGLVGIGGGGFSAAIASRLSNEELAKTETEVDKAIKAGLVKPEEAQQIQQVVNEERQARASAPPAERVAGVYQAGDVLISKAGGQFTVVADLGATKVKVMDAKGKILTRNKNRLKLADEQQGTPDAAAPVVEPVAVTAKSEPVPAPAPEKLDDFVKEWELGVEDFNDDTDIPPTVAPVSGTAGPTPQATAQAAASPSTPTTQTTVEAPAITKGANVQFVDGATGQTVSGKITSISDTTGLAEIEVDGQPGRPAVVATKILKPAESDGDVAMSAEDIEADEPISRGDAVYVGQDTSKIGEVVGTRSRDGVAEVLVRIPGGPDVDDTFRTVPRSELALAENRLVEGDPVYVNENNHLWSGTLDTINISRGLGLVKLDEGSFTTVPLRKIILGQRSVDDSKGFVVLSETEREGEKERTYTTLEDAIAGAKSAANIVPIDGTITVRAKADHDRYAEELSQIPQAEFQDKFRSVAAPADLFTTPGERMVQKHGRVEIPMIRADVGGRKGVALQQPTAKAVLDLNKLGIETVSSGWRTGFDKWAIIAYKPDPETYKVLQALGGQTGIGVNDHWKLPEMMVMTVPDAPVGHQAKAENSFNRFVGKIKEIHEAPEVEQAETETPKTATDAPKVPTSWRKGNAIQARHQELGIVYGRILAIKGEEAMVEFHVRTKTVKRSVKLKQLRPVTAAFKVDNIVTAPDMTGVERPARILEIDPPEAEIRRAMVEFAHETTQPFSIMNVSDLIPSSTDDVAMSTEGESALSSPLARSMAARRTESGRSPAMIAAQFGASPTDVDTAPEIGEAGDFGWISFSMSQFLLDTENEEHLEETAAALLGEDDMVFELIAGDYKDRQAVMFAILDTLANQQGVDRSSQMTPEQWDQAIITNAGTLRPEVRDAMVAAGASTAQWHKNQLGFIEDPELQQYLAKAHAGQMAAADLKKVVAIGQKYDQRSTVGPSLGSKVNEGLSDNIIKRTFARTVQGRLPNDSVRRSSQRATEGAGRTGPGEGDIATSSEDIKPQSIWQRLKDAITNPTPSQALADRRRTTMRIDPEKAREALYEMAPLSLFDGTGEVGEQIDSEYQMGERSPEYTPSAIEMPLDPPDVHMADAWHGTPQAIHKSPEGKFSLKYLGTGEGAQAFGYGLYFASREKVADYYRNSLSGPTMVSYKNRRAGFDDLPGPDHSDIEDVAADDVANHLVRGYTFPEAVQAITSFYQELYDTQTVMAGRWAQASNPIAAQTAQEGIDEARQILDALTTLQESDFEIKRGGFKYKVEIKPTEDSFLLWETPLKEQSEKVQAALKEARLAGRGIYNPDVDGESIYRLLSKTLAPELESDTADGGWNSINPIEKAADRLASEYLKALGIRGIKYPEGSLQNKRTDNFNYVLFSDEDVEIKEVVQARATGLQTIKSYDKVGVGALATFHKARVEKDGTFVTSAQGQQLLRRAMEWAFGKPYTPFFGIYFRSDQSPRIQAALDQMALAESEAGNMETAQRLKAFAKTFKEATNPVYNDVVMTIDLGAAFEPAMVNVKAEERAHQADHRTRQRESLDTAPFQSILGYQKAVGHLATGAYKGASTRVIHNEVIAKIFRPDALANLNITEAERSEIERAYLQQLLTADIPPQAIVTFFEGVDSVYAKNFTETAKVIREAQARAAKRAFHQAARPPGAVGPTLEGGASAGSVAASAVPSGTGGPIDGRSGQPVSGRPDPQEEAASVAMSAEDIEPIAEDELTEESFKQRTDDFLMRHAPDFLTKGGREGLVEFAANTFRSGVLAAWGPIKTNLYGNPINVLSEQLTVMFGAAIAYSRHKALGHDTKYGAAGRTPGDIAAGFRHALMEGILGNKGALNALRKGVDEAPDREGGENQESEAARLDMESWDPQIEGEGLEQLKKIPTALKAPYIVARVINESVKRAFIAIDKPFSKFGEEAQLHAQARKVAKQLKEDGVVDSWKEAIRIATANPDPADQDIAQLMGQLGTFQNPNLITDVIGDARRALTTGSWIKNKKPSAIAGSRLLGKVVYLALATEVPFVRTVSNIGLRTAEYAFPPYAAFKAAMLYRIAGGKELPIPEVVEKILGSEWSDYARNLNLRVHDLATLDEKWAAQDKKTKALRQEETRTIKRPILQEIKKINDAIDKSERAKKKADAAIMADGSLTAEQKLAKVNANEEKFAAHSLKAAQQIQALENKKDSALKYLTTQQKAENEERRIERENLRAQREEYHTKREFIEADLTLARGGIGALVLLPFMAGLITGMLDAMGEIDYDDEPEKWQASRKAGIPEGSVKIPGTTYRWPMHLAPVTRALSIYTTAWDQAQRPGTTAQKSAAIGEALYSRGLLTLNPYTDPTFQREGGAMSKEAWGDRLVKFTPGLNLGILREAGEVIDEQPRSTRGEGFMGPVFRQIPPGLGIGRENLPVSKNPLGGMAGRGTWDRRFGRLILEPPRASWEVSPQSRLKMKPLVPKKKK